jgi:precorrin-2 dehydrogenase/sirohydrochlorin ferrochelatase
LRSSRLSEYYPIYLHIKGRKCLVVGGGDVAYRKVLALLESQASVEVVSPELCQRLEGLASQGRIKAVARPYRKADLKGAVLVVAATDVRAVNQAVSREAIETGLLVNVVDDPQLSSFIVPSVVQRGDVAIAVSTSGRSPALARRIRHKLEEEIGEEYGALALLLDEIRRELKGSSTKADGEAWQKALDLDLLLGWLKNGQKEKAREFILQNLKCAILVKGV